MKQKHSSILLSGFEYEKIDGAIDPRKIALKLDEMRNPLDQHLGKLMDGIVAEFGLQPLSHPKWIASEIDLRMKFGKFMWITLWKV
ncbi:hypothetical protein LI177_04760 [bacterium 210820-DFI.6.37]|nr:hypothetical protein [bacterium 210820-DFI.6.37]